MTASDGERAQAATPLVITVASGKGGVGKTNVSVNLAVALAMKGNKTWLFDADLGLANVDVLLGLSPQRTLAHVLEGDCDLNDIVLTGPEGVRIIPASSGVQRMAELSLTESSGLIHAFSELGTDVDVLIVDTAAGINQSVTMFAAAAHEVLVVVCNEPASITDAYALIKVLSREHGVQHVQVLANMVRSSVEGRELYQKIARVTDRYLDITVRYAGFVPHDEFLRRALQRQEPVITAYPACRATQAFKKLAEATATWRGRKGPQGQIEFFLEQALGVVS
ncbi:cobyrinic acid a,c-diamide synthase [Kineobactrum sediminis]|uniref:Cobyrinic acid a,c-diamide synthase n=1 Tax=Kineobactrum sediminis TaxID=1905677 RepID=A0A2N5Y7T0_9GAMM|nr:cobyrinic acid a,c-diamide synthase [Kineobactrum sediminis]